ncbi:hypothetical protein N42HA_01488 [Lactococcus lactis]|uniref:hypothetical protein n=1 Tax=Lactococcus lactis TaxID=1358 RepID=UPI00155E6750|nr:hypothetical protein [Lactococcus lactis]MDU0408475.1 hypothetical protein [Lactococcus lactis]NRD16263.1 hypothetical protein [Lactococcus lactis subsp. lactis]
MTIVASNSLTVSNVNDGTITHVAYANSADGTDGFTTVYPNLNLLNAGFNLNIAMVGTGENNYNQGGPRFYINSGLYMSQLFNIGDIFTVSFSFKVESQTASGQIMAQIDGGSWATYAKANISPSESEIILTQSIVVDETFITSNNNSRGIKINLNKAPTSTKLTLTNFKLEIGNKRTPWMPSSSEVTTADWPSYIGQYSDFTSTASTDPAKYVPWTVFKGIDGNNGRGIVSSEQKYQLTQTSAKPVDPWDNSVWQTTQPTTTATNKYLWSITRTTFNLAPLTQDIVEQKAVYGDKGTDGNPGKIVSDTEPTTRFKGLTWKYSGTADLTAIDGTVIKPNVEYYYNGTHWIINLIEANQIHVIDLSAISGTFTNGSIKNVAIDGPVTSTILIEKKHILFTFSDSSQNTTNTLELDSQQGYANTFVDSNSGRTRTVQANFQGFFTSDTDGPSAQLTPYGVYVTNGLQTTTVSLGSGINATLAKIGQMCQISINSNSSNVPAGNGVALSGNIPAGWRPAIGTPFEVMMYSGTAFQRPLHITIGTDGKLSIVNASASSYWCFGGTTYMLA